jgi:hypothetical protein
MSAQVMVEMLDVDIVHIPQQLTEQEEQITPDW